MGLEGNKFSVSNVFNFSLAGAPTVRALGEGAGRAGAESPGLSTLSTNQLWLQGKGLGLC